MKLRPAVVRAGIVLVAGLLVMGFTVWRTYPRISSNRSLLNPNLKYMHCPECRTETRFDVGDVDKPCKQCSYDKGLIATEESIRERSPQSAYGRMVAFLLPEFILVMGALWFVLRPPPVRPDSYRYMRCPDCGQKLRFRVAQIDLLGACTRCRKPLRFPEGTTKEEDLDGSPPQEDFEYEDEEE
jgi:hypothetical protein